MAKEGFKDGMCKIRDGYMHPEQCLHPSELRWGAGKVSGCLDPGSSSGCLDPGCSLDIGKGSGCRTQWHSGVFGWWIPGQEREAATCSMKLARLMSRSDKPPQSWVLKVM